MTLKEYLTNIADTLRGLLGIDDTINAQDFPDKITEVYDAGKQAEHDRFWDSYQNCGNRVNYTNAFAGNGWTAEIFKPLYDIVPITTYMMFYQNTINVDLVEYLKELNITLDFSKCVNLQYLFGNAAFTRVGIIDTTSCSNLSYVFASATKLVTIDKLILKSDGSQTVNKDCFSWCGALENVIIEGVIGVNNFNFQWSTKLTKDSILGKEATDEEIAAGKNLIYLESSDKYYFGGIFGALSDTADGMSITLSLTAVNNAFGGDASDESAYSAEWAELLGAKPNWTINLI